MLPPQAIKMFEHTLSQIFYFEGQPTLLNIVKLMNKTATRNSYHRNTFNFFTTSYVMGNHAG